MLQAARGSGRPCRTLSLTATLQMLGNLWLSAAIQSAGAELRTLFQTHQIALQDGNRPGHNEPRVNKRRPKVLKLMTEPRPKSPACQAA